MNLEIQEYSFGERPQVTRPSREILKLLGEAGIRKLVDDHYSLLRESNAGHLFPKDDEEFEAAKKRSSDFFIQILGGPQYFNQNRGEPMLVRRHKPFTITIKERKIWLDCYRKLLPELGLPDELLMSYWNYLNVFSTWMVNTEE